MNNTIRINLTVHLFALAHAVAIIVMRYLLGWSDDVVLTILTILMVIVITRQQGLPLDVAAVLALLSCFAGFYMGTKGAEWLSGAHCTFVARYDNLFTTVIVTELLGWTNYFITTRIKRRR